MSKKRRDDDDAVDEMSEESFPASDPPSTTPPGGTKAARELKQAHEGSAEGGNDAGEAGEAKPTGRPTSDRYETETAFARQQDTVPAESADPSTEERK